MKYCTDAESSRVNMSIGLVVYLKVSNENITTNKAYNSSARESRKPILDTSIGYILITCSKNDRLENRTINKAVRMIKNKDV